jgi:sarcosine oxidase, subunit gamma
MSDPVSALGGTSFDGFANIREIGPLGMISLRCRHDVKALPKAIKTAVGAAMPAPNRIVRDGAWAAGWMSPDEVLLVMPYDQVGQTMAGLAKSLAGEHHLAVDVSDARAVFRVEGAKAAQVLMKLAPVDPPWHPTHCGAHAPPRWRRRFGRQMGGILLCVSGLWRHM